MKTKALFASALICLLATTTLAFALNFREGTWEDDGIIKVRIKKGWNLLPLRLLNDIQGRYHSTFRAGLTTCSFDVAREVWMWSPVAGKYEFFLIDEWDSPDTTNNQFLRNEFQNQYYHAFLGSAWIFSPKDCVLAFDDAHEPYQGYSLSATTYGSVGQPSKSYVFDDLVLKKGWNFIPMDTWMTVNAKKNYYDVFGDCVILKTNYWDHEGQEWGINSSNHMGIVAQSMMEESAPNIGEPDVFWTLLIKVENDCKISKTDRTSGPPALPE